MRSTLRMALVSGTIALGLTAVSAQAAANQKQAQRREEAKAVIAASLQERLVRPVPAGEIDRAARDVVRSLSNQQVDALLKDGKVGAPTRPRSIAASAEGEALQNVTAQALGDADSDLLFVPVSPCRIIDTRLAGGRIAPGPGGVRHFEVAGTTGFEAQGGQAGG